MQAQEESVAETLARQTRLLVYFATLLLDSLAPFATQAHSDASLK